MADCIPVSAVLALANRQVVVNVLVPSGATVAEVVEVSGLRSRFPEISDPVSCAIFGRAVTYDHVVRAGDRVEILRPLLIDPKEGRRRAAASTRGRAPTRS